MTRQRTDQPLGRRAIGAAVPVMHVFGVDVFAHWSIVIVPFAILAAVAPLVTPGGLTPGAALGWTLVWTLATLLVIASHELAHAWEARRAGAVLDAVVLTPLGPISHDEPPAAGRMSEILVNIAGPLAHVAWLAPAALAIWLLRGEGAAAAPPELMARAFFLGNLALAALNLLPFYPLDGGRALRGILSAWVGQQRAELWSAYIGYAGAVVLGLVGLTLLLAHDAVYVAWAILLVVVGVANFVAAQRLLFAAQFLAHQRVDSQAFTDLFDRAPGADDESILDIGHKVDTSARAPRPAKDVEPEDEDDDETLVESADERRQRLTERIDALLDRINEVGGVGNLTPAERAELAEASEMLRGERTA